MDVNKLGKRDRMISRVSSEIRSLEFRRSFGFKAYGSGLIKSRQGAIAFAGGIEGTHVGPEDSNFPDCSNVMFPDVYEVEIWKMRGLALFSQSSQAHVQCGDGRELPYLFAASCCAGHGILLNLQPFKTISVRSLSALMDRTT